jgi:hypothetical protein
MAIMHHRVRITGIVCTGLMALVLTGCESASWTHTLNESFAAKPERGPRTEEEHRREYIATHSRKSLRWLLAHRVKPGMSYNDVCHMLGEDGTREERDRWLKTSGINIRIDDEVYAFGPDSENRTLYLFFREDRLINFDPTDFE